MNVTNDGGPAFPRPPFTPGTLHDNAADVGFASTGHPGISLRFASTGHPGMSLRDWFAGHDDLSDIPEDFAESCMNALAGRPMPLPPATQVLTPPDWIAVEQWNADWRAKLKYIRADAMLRARERGHEGGAR